MAPETMRSRSFRGGLLVLLFILFVAGVAGGHYYLYNTLKDVQSRKNSVMRQEANVRHAAKTDEALLQAYKRTLASLSRQPVKFPQDQVAFLSNVEKQLTEVGVEKVSITSTRVDKGGMLTATVQFTGPYYQVLEGIAGWRTMEEIVKMQSLAMKFEASGKVSGTTLLETRVREEAP